MVFSKDWDSQWKVLGFNLANLSVSQGLRHGQLVMDKSAWAVLSWFQRELGMFPRVLNLSLLDLNRSETSFLVNYRDSAVMYILK